MITFNNIIVGDHNGPVKPPYNHIYIIYIYITHMDMDIAILTIHGEGSLFFGSHHVYQIIIDYISIS